jgi:hypothetical protein
VSGDSDLGSLSIRIFSKISNFTLCDTITIKNAPNPNLSPLVGPNLFSLNTKKSYNDHLSWTNGKENIFYISTSGENGNWLFGFDAGVDSGFVYLESQQNTISPLEILPGKQWKWLQNNKWVDQPAMRMVCVSSKQKESKETTKNSAVYSAPHFHKIEYFRPSDGQLSAGYLVSNFPADKFALKTVTSTSSNPKNKRSNDSFLLAASLSYGIINLQSMDFLPLTNLHTLAIFGGIHRLDVFSNDFFHMNRILQQSFPDIDLAGEAETGDGRGGEVSAKKKKKNKNKNKLTDSNNDNNNNNDNKDGTAFKRTASEELLLLNVEHSYNSAWRLTFRVVNEVITPRGENNNNNNGKEKHNRLTTLGKDEQEKEEQQEEEQEQERSFSNFDISSSGEILSDEQIENKKNKKSDKNSKKSVANKDNSKNKKKKGNNRRLSAEKQYSRYFFPEQEEEEEEQERERERERADFYGESGEEDNENKKNSKKSKSSNNRGTKPAEEIDLILQMKEYRIDLGNKGIRSVNDNEQAENSLRNEFVYELIPLLFNEQEEHSAMKWKNFYQEKLFPSVEVGDYLWLWQRTPATDLSSKKPENIEELLVKCIFKLAANYFVFEVFPTHRLDQMKQSILDKNKEMLVINLHPNSTSSSSFSVTPGALTGRVGNKEMEIFSTLLIPRERILQFLLNYLLVKEKKLNNLSTCYFYHAAVTVPQSLLYAAEILCVLIGSKPIVLVRELFHFSFFPVIID